MDTNDFSNIKLVSSLNENINIMKNIFLNDITVVYRELSIGKSAITKCMLIYIGGMANSQIINENVIAPILLSDISFTNHSKIIDVLMQKVLLTGDNKKSDIVDDIINGII